MSATEKSYTQNFLKVKHIIQAILGQKQMKNSIVTDKKNISVYKNPRTVFGEIQNF